MDIIYDSLLILGPISIFWLIKNFNRKNRIFFFVNLLFFLLSPLLLLLSLYIIEEILHYVVLVYVWSLISYFSMSLLLKKNVILSSVLLAITINSIIVYAIPNKPGQFHYDSYWRRNSNQLDVNVLDKYQIEEDVDIKKIYRLVKCQIKKTDWIDKWKFNVNYKSYRDTTVDFKHLKSYKHENCQLDLFEYTSYRVPSKTSQCRELFDKEKETFAIISVSGKPDLYIDELGRTEAIIQELMVDFDFYNDFLLFRWENGSFWDNMANSYSPHAKKIGDLKKC